MPRNLAQEPTYANPLETYHLHCDTLPKKTVQMDGQSYLWLGGTNYLGIGDHPLFQEKLKEGIAHFSQNWGSSRINNFQISARKYDVSFFLDQIKRFKWYHVIRIFQPINRIKVP